MSEWIAKDFTIYEQETGLKVASIDNKGHLKETAERNTRLIAAAPEMYELLIKTLDDTQNGQFAREDLICELLTRIDGIKRESQIY